MMETTVVVDESGLPAPTNRSLGTETSSAAMDPLLVSLAVDLRQSLKEAEERRDEQIALVASLAGEDRLQWHAQNVLMMREETLRLARRNLDFMEIFLEPE